MPGPRALRADSSLNRIDRHSFALDLKVGKITTDCVEIAMVRRKCVRGRAIWQPLLVVFISVVILFTSLIGTGATTRVNRDFLDAAFNGDTKAVEALLAEGADVNARNGRELTPLQITSQKGYQSIVTLLEKHGR